MSLDSSLKSGAGLNRHRNVLTRTERLQRLLAQGKMSEQSAHVLAMPKVGNRKIAVGKKSGKKVDDAADATPAAGPAGGAGATGASGGAKKAAAPAAAPAKKK